MKEPAVFSISLSSEMSTDLFALADSAAKSGSFKRPACAMASTGSSASVKT
jgi:hypothetical protein